MPPRPPQPPASWATATQLLLCPRPFLLRPPRAPPSCSTRLHSYSPTGCSEAIPPLGLSPTHPPGKRPAELGVHTSTRASEDPAGSHLHPAQPGDCLPLNPGSTTSRGRTLRKKHDRELRKTQPRPPAPTACLARHVSRPPSADPSRPLGSAETRPAQRCLTPGKPRSHAIGSCHSIHTSCERGEGVREPPASWNCCFQVTARGRLPQKGHPPATTESLAFEALQRFFLPSLFCY